MAIYENPANATVGRFIGQANVWDGIVRAVDGDRLRIELSSGVDVLATGSGLTPGAACRAFVKHESVALARTRPAQADNCFAGRISGRTYLGGSTSYVVALAGGLTLRAVVPHRAGFEHYQPGDEVLAAWPADAGQVFRG